MRQPEKHPTRLRRPAFTLIELLVVIAIIAVLAAMSAGAYFAVIGRQQNNNTQTALQALNKALREHWDQVVADARKEEPSAEVVALAGDRQRAKVVWVKLRLMEAFPASFDEIINQDQTPYAFFPYRPIVGLAPQGLIPFKMRKHMPDYKKKLTGTSPSADEAQSAACLLLALSVSRGGIRFDRDTLGSAYFTDTNGDGIEEVVDGYKKAVRLFRFPTGSAALQAAAPQKTGKGTAFTDPLDPDGMLFTWAAGPARKLFEDNVHKISTGTQACYCPAVLVSAGKDLQFGLNVDMSAASAQEADNVYSFKLKQ